MADSNQKWIVGDSSEEPEKTDLAMQEETVEVSILTSCSLRL